MRVIADHLAIVPVKSCRRWLATWAIAGATIHATLPALHGAITPFGPVALWLWLLPTAAIGLHLLLERDNRAAAELAPCLPARRRRTGTSRRYAAVTRRDRLPAAPRPAARPVRRAG